MQGTLSQIPCREIPSMQTHDLLGARPKQATLNRNIWQQDYVHEQINNQPNFQNRQENLGKKIRSPLFSDFHYQKVDLNKPTTQYAPPEIYRPGQFVSKVSALDHQVRPQQQYNDSLQTFLLRQSAASSQAKDSKQHLMKDHIQSYEQEYGKNKSDLVMHIDPGKTMQRSQPFANFQTQQIDESKYILRGDATISNFQKNTSSYYNNTGNNQGGQSPSTMKNINSNPAQNFLQKQNSINSQLSTERMHTYGDNNNNNSQKSPTNLNNSMVNQQQKYSDYLNNNSQMQRSNSQSQVLPQIRNSRQKTSSQSNQQKYNNQNNNSQVTFQDNKSNNYNQISKQTKNNDINQYQALLKQNGVQSIIKSPTNINNNSQQQQHQSHQNLDQQQNNSQVHNNHSNSVMHTQPAENSNINTQQQQFTPAQKSANKFLNQPVGSQSASIYGKKTYKPYNVVTHKRHQQYEPKYELPTNHWECYDKPQWESYVQKKEAPTNIFKEKNRNNFETGDFSTSNVEYGQMKRKYKF